MRIVNCELRIENLPLVISIADDQFSMANCQSTLPNFYYLQIGFVPKRAGKKGRHFCAEPKTETKVFFQKKG
jgi:hypothetical protein